MKRLPVTEFHELAKAIVAIKYTKEVKTLLDQLEEEKLSVKSVTGRINDLVAAVPDFNQ